MIPLDQWTPRPRPGNAPLSGAVVRVEPIVDSGRFGELYESFTAPGGDTLWAYLPYGPFEDRAAFESFAGTTYRTEDPLFHAIVPALSGKAEGVASLMRIDPPNGVVEIGHICLGPGLQGTRAATEAFYLLFRRVFEELGYRRLEWKCNDANAPSKRAAERLGFTFEGLFRQHMIVKGANRDTAWYAILDSEWPAIAKGFESWLAAENFDEAGRQRRSLASFRTAA
ncbi:MULTISPECIES: GNAT family N-acetyltransferase [unclassified Aureimonas]|uniref:GNAT family N-acetyltransferase n=1 Tax=unclassified Aureimonas TaxID=2615206 RepID=UPI0006FB6B08|nr:MULTISPECIES: GNAT family protein [unclassified Aureimonas]KQT60735.1 GNAT family acetyltransferase [Aureimonas sp. Leaf460]KQT68864.1 GNAT family acetyltransferase [Aureimonas sp. Leaf427]